MNDTQQATGAESTDATDNMAAEAPGTEKSSTGKGKRRALTFLILLLILGAGAGAGWYYQSMWLPEAKNWFVAWLPSDEKPDSMAAPMVDEHFLGKAGKSESTFVLSAITEPQVKPETSKESETPEVISQQPEAVSKPVVIADTAAESDMVVQQVEPDAVASAAAVPVPEISTENKMPMPDVITEMDNTPLPSVTNVQSIQQARQAFWSRDLVTAEKLYMQLIKNDVQNTDAWGELGNLYYLQAKWPQAATAYTEAALRLLDKGEYPRAMFLHYIVRGLDPRQASRVDEQLRRMQTPVSH